MTLVPRRFGQRHVYPASPDAPDMPFASRSTQPDAAADAPQMPMDVEAAANGLEAKLEAGGDVTGWQLLARTKSALRHWDKAANAYRHLDSDDA